MKLWKFISATISATLVALIFSALQVHAAPDRVCNYTVGSTTISSGFANCTEEIGDLAKKSFAIATVTGTDTIVGTSSPAVTSLTNGQTVQFTAANTNTGSATFQLDGTASATIYRVDGTTTLALGDLVAGGRYMLSYQASPARWILISPNGAGAGGGGGGTPGGGNGDIQYNNLGSFGGFTASGDATINTGTGAVTIANDAVSFAKMQNVSANSVPARAAGSSGDLSEVALSASQLLGRGSSGDVAAITLGSGLSMSGTTLDTAGGIQLQTPVATTSGTFIDFTGIPSTAKRVTLQLFDVSTNSTSPLLVQLGDSGGIETTGYNSNGSSILGSVGSLSATNGIIFGNSWAAASLSAGIITIQKFDTNSYTVIGQFGPPQTTGTALGSGSKAVSAGPIDRIRLTTSGGTATFDAGSAVISWEN